MGMLWQVNPRKRKRKMSAKQRKYFGGGKRKTRRSRKSSRRHRQAGFVAVPSVRKVHRRRRSRKGAVGRIRRRGRGRARRSFKLGGALGFLKAGVIGGAGAVLTDFAMGQVVKFLPASLATPLDSAGNAQYGYFGVKAALAIALGTYGGRLPVVGRYAPEMAQGALTVLAYQFLRPLAQQALPMALGYLNPAPTQRPQLGRYVSGMGAYPALPVRAAGGSGKGSRAANVMSMVSNTRRAA